MSYDAKILSARAVLEAHNSNAPENQVNIDGFFQKLSAAGGTTEEAIAASTWEDLEHFGLPVLLARQVAGVFRAASQEEKPSAWVGEKKVRKMTPLDLLTVYDPKEPDSPVAVRLDEMAKEQPFIVFMKDGKVDIIASAKLLDEIRQGHKPRDFYDNGTGRGPVRIYKVGDGPNRLADENPIYGGEALRPDSTCSQTGRSWQSVSLTIRRLIRLARETGEIPVNSPSDAHNIIDLAISDSAEAKVRQRCPNASVEYNELELKGELPSLRIPVGGTNGKPNNPFFQPHRKF